MKHSPVALFALLAALAASCMAPPPPPPAPPPPNANPDFVPPAGVAVPPGTRFTVRMYDSVNTKQHKQGHRFTMILEADLVVDGQTVAPRGSIVYGVVSQATSSGRIAGRSSLTLQPTDIMVGSRMYPLVAGEVQAVAATGTGAKTAGRTVRATAVGGMIGGKSGRETGAKVGLTASLLSDDGQIQVPSGTLLEFPLMQPLAF